MPLSILVNSGYLEPVQDRVYAIGPEGESCSSEYCFAKDYRLRVLSQCN